MKENERYIILNSPYTEEDLPFIRAAFPHLTTPQARTISELGRAGIVLDQVLNRMNGGQVVRA